MKRFRLLRFLFASVFVLLLAAGLVVLPVVRELRQEQRNGALIEAVKANDERAVVRLLNEGRMPTQRICRRIPVPSGVCCGTVFGINVKRERTRLQQHSALLLTNPYKTRDVRPIST